MRKSSGYSELKKTDFGFTAKSKSEVGEKIGEKIGGKRGGRSAACARRGGESSECSRHERESRADLLGRGRQIGATRTEGLRALSRHMRRARSLVGATEGAFRLFSFGPHGVQVVAGRYYREQQNESTTKSAEEQKGPDLAIRRRPLPPQQTGGRQQGQPAEIKKKFHTKHSGPLEETPRPGGTASR